MAKLIYVTPTSLIGCIADETGDFDWAAPDEEGFAFINDIVRPFGTYLYPRYSHAGKTPGLNSG